MSRNVLPDRSILTLAELPQTGLVPEADVLSYGGLRRLLPASPSTFRRYQEKGEAPPAVISFGRRCIHAEHVRALALGQDWREVALEHA